MGALGLKPQLPRHQELQTATPALQKSFFWDTGTGLMVGLVSSPRLCPPLPLMTD